MYTKIKEQLSKDWPIVKLGNLIEIRSSKRVLESEWTDTGVPFYRGRDVNKLSKNEDISPVFISNEKYLELKNITGVPKIGDIIITAIGTLGKVHIIDNEDPFYFKDGTILWFKMNNKIQPDYLKFLFLSNIILDQIKYFSNVTTVGAYTIDTARNTLITLPEVNEQIKIVNFLDNQCLKIDKEIELLEKKSILLDEYKNALIYETVTKGLNKNAEMKDSGIEWIGEIPKHWELKRVKDLFNISRGRVIAASTLEKESTNILKYPVFSAATENDGIIGYLDTYDFNNDLLTWTTDGAKAGSVFLRSGQFNCTNVCGLLQPKFKNSNLKFQKYSLSVQTPNYQRPDINGAKIMSNEMAKILIAQPDVYEQSLIAQFLDSETNEIENKIKLMKKKIELLKEYKQSLIYEVVTGQLDIE